MHISTLVCSFSHVEKYDMATYCERFQSITIIINHTLHDDTFVLKNNKLRQPFRFDFTKHGESMLVGLQKHGESMRVG